MSTPALLKKVIGLKIICIDATYKLNWNGFPLIVLETVDRRKMFHPLLYACVSHETTEDYGFVFESLINAIETFFKEPFEPTTLIADGAMAIRNAFYNVFESAELDIMCFAHVIRNIRKRSFAMRNKKQLILDDIRKTQSAPSRVIFQLMTDLFCQKWQQLEPNFIDYSMNDINDAIFNVAVIFAILEFKFLNLNIQLNIFTTAIFSARGLFNGKLATVELNFHHQHLKYLLFD